MSRTRPASDALPIAGNTGIHRSAPLVTERTCVDDVCFDNIDRGLALAIIRRFLEDSEHHGPRLVSFANVHTITVARRDHELRYALHRADLVLPDGSGLALAGRVTGLPVRENLNGTDFIPLVLAMLAEQGRSVFLLGAREHVVAACAQDLPRRFPGLRIAGYRHGHFAGSDDGSVLAAITGARPDVLLVAMGTPVQEVWTTAVAHSLPVRICITVGGLFDFLSGERQRAPRWVRRLGMEWLFRFLHEPARKWDRVLMEIPGFLFRLAIRQMPVTRGTGRSHGGTGRGPRRTEE